MQRFQLKRDDGDISICHWSAPGKPVLHWAHANGFNAQTYDPLLTRSPEILTFMPPTPAGTASQHLQLTPRIIRAGRNIVTT